jgi:hypothetical protein
LPLPGRIPGGSHRTSAWPPPPSPDRVRRRRSGSLTGGISSRWRRAERLSRSCDPRPRAGSRRA